MKILLVDDDADIRMVFAYALRDENISVHEAADGLYAIEAVQKEDFDAVIMDISMPRVDGITAIGALRKMRHGRFVPIIVVTALRDPELRRRALEAGAAEYLEKPLAPSEVMAAVRRNLHAGTPNPDQTEP